MKSFLNFFIKVIDIYNFFENKFGILIFFGYICIVSFLKCFSLKPIKR